MGLIKHRKVVTWFFCLAMMSILLFCGSPVQAAQDGDYTYTVTIGGQAQIVRYTGAGGVVAIPSRLGGFPVTSINYMAFKDCTEVTSINIPAGVTSLALEAFRGCTNLTSVTIPQGVTIIDSAAFYDCINLSSISIPAGVTSVDSSVFENCTSLTSINIPSSVSSIDSDAFRGCTSLTSITIQPGVTSIGQGAFMNCSGLSSITIPQGVTNMSWAVFWGCTGLTSITIPSSVTSIDTSAFNGCSSLANITIPYSVTSIAATAFANCASLSSITFNSATTTIFDGADTIPSATKIKGYDPSTAKDHHIKYGNEFESLGTAPILESIAITAPAAKLSYSVGNTLDLTGLVITGAYSDGSHRPERITETNISGFNSSTATADQVLTITVGGQTVTYHVQIVGAEPTNPDYTYTISNNHATITGYSGAGGAVTIPGTLAGATVISIGEAAFYHCISLTSISIPAGVTSIEVDAFNGCSNLTSITIPPGVTRISDNTFAYCSALSSVTIPSSVTSIGEGAFSNCSNLTSISVPPGLTSIGSAAFWLCSHLTSISLPASITIIESSAFGYCDRLSSISIPPGVTGIGSEAFTHCTGLTGITIPPRVLIIGIGAFDGCSGITSISIPQSVASIGDAAFTDCLNLASITFHSVTTTIYDSSPTIPATTKIIGSDPSTAKAYATKYGRTFETISRVQVLSEKINNNQQLSLYFTSTFSGDNVTFSIKTGQEEANLGQSFDVLTLMALLREVETEQGCTLDSITIAGSTFLRSDLINNFTATYQGIQQAIIRLADATGTPYGNLKLRQLAGKTIQVQMVGGQVINLSVQQIDECFIATAAFGSKFTWPVALLRHFRDQYLLTNALGTAFVKIYYQYSPPIAAMIANSQPLKVLVRVLLAPVIALVYMMYHPMLTAPVLGLLIMFFMYHSKLRRREVRA